MGSPNLHKLQSKLNSFTNSVLKCLELQNSVMKFYDKLQTEQTIVKELKHLLTNPGIHTTKMFHPGFSDKIFLFIISTTPYTIQMFTGIRGKITALVAKNWDLQQLEPYTFC